MYFLKLFGLRRVFVPKSGDLDHEAAESGGMVSDVSFVPHQ